MAVQLICYMDEGEKNLFFCVCLNKKLSQMKEILSHTDHCFSFIIFIYLLYGVWRALHLQTCIRGSQNVKRTLFIVSSTEGTQNLFSAQKAEADLLSSLVTVVTLAQSVWPGTFWFSSVNL